MARRTVSYLIITLLTVVIYTAGFLVTQYIFQSVPGYSPLLAGAAMALVLAILFDPLLSLVQRLVNRLISGIGYDPSHTLREYSMSVSNIVELGYLATVAVGLISEAMEIQRGALFVVHYERGENGEEGGNGYFRLRGVGGMGEDLPPGVLSADSPVAGYLHQERHPLTQYDIDLLPRFQATSAEERTWLSGLDMDVYVPIHTKGEWIGILTLGPKVSGDRYFDDDLALLSTLADQTAVALENARLVENLIRAHNDLGQAYAALNQANRRLQELDKLKSAFIGVITHELRTPFANIVFSLELLERYGQKNLTPELREQLEQLLEQLTAGITSARTMVDNLVTFATFLSKQGELSLAWLDFGQVIQGSLLPLKSLAESKPITLQAEVPEELPPLHGDRDRLADAIYHLVHNAVKFTEAGGDVWVRCQATAYKVCFEVQDTGVGVPADKLPTLWEGFTQMADPLRRGVEGLGLGLALVKYIVNAHGGDVWAQSEEGVGSTFGFHIPLVSAERPPLEALKGVETLADTAKPVKTG
jgi:signal transduction histidine kinase